MELDGNPRSRKQPRRADEEGGEEPEEGEVDRITELPDALRREILCLLPLKWAIRTGVLSSRWRGLWAQRWPEPSSLRFELAASDRSSRAQGQEQLGVMERRGRRRLDRLYLAFQAGQLVQSDLKRCVEYVAACGVEDVEIQQNASGRGRGRRAALSCPFPPGSRQLARLSLRGVHLTAPLAHAPLLSALEVIHLHSVSLTEAALRKVVAACPRLRTLELHGCRQLRRVDVAHAGVSLRSITVVDCNQATELRVSPTPRLQSFRFSGAFLPSYMFPNNGSLSDFYFCSSGPDSGLPRSNWVFALPNLSNLTVLTLCSIALQYVCAWSYSGRGNLNNLRSLKELQLLMFGMANANLADIYSFFKACPCPQLERFFVQLPTSTYDPFTANFLEMPEEEPPEDGLGNLKVVKMTSFKGHHNEMQLVSFLLRQASCLHKMLLVSPWEDHLEELKTDESVVPHHYIKTHLLLLTKASANAQITFDEIDDPLIQPFHSEVFVKF